jgi:hypothetical protein
VERTISYQVKYPKDRYVVVDWFIRMSKLNQLEQYL